MIKILLALDNFEYSGVRLVLLLEAKSNMLEELFTSEMYDWIHTMSHNGKSKDIREFDSSDSSYDIMNQMDVISFSFLDSPMKVPHGSLH
ncbi:hypothetical protein PoB_001304800 [Plakobranchus ocellatus]|uniref:Uncharacterized protein n=1 Tax=Plakobranchus ocellatus TaxID=259542 RepID=A0AAV3YWD3_9GAST|nr:hypothetical protein PoB_001304800 [Plakobranchus ocellatus]